jgi:hypothetical protein
VRRSLFPSDESLPTWLHTLLCILVVSPFAGFLLWHGVHAIATAHLEPLSGPSLGQLFFGPVAINGKAAKVAGVSLIALGCAFVAFGFSYSRLVQGNKFLRLLPWVLLAAYIAISIWVKKLLL